MPPGRLRVALSINRAISSLESMERKLEVWRPHPTPHGTRTIEEPPTHELLAEPWSRRRETVTGQLIGSNS